MELRAVISALEFVTGELDAGDTPLHVHTDSQYVQRGMNEWLSRWLRNGFKTAAKKPVKNKELWVELNELSKHHDIRWHWVRGHAGDRSNEECDALVQRAIRELT
jgi:ribonuclease HI